MRPLLFIASLLRRRSSPLWVRSTGTFNARPHRYLSFHGGDLVRRSQRWDELARRWIRRARP